MTKPIVFNTKNLKVGDRVSFNLIGEKWFAKILEIKTSKALVKRETTGGDYSIPLDNLTKEKKHVYKVGVSWQVYGFDEVEADSIEEAYDIANDGERSLPTDADYVEGSFEVDRDCDPEVIA